VADLEFETLGQIEGLELNTNNGMSSSQVKTVTSVVAGLPIYHDRGDISAIALLKCTL